MEKLKLLDFLRFTETSLFKRIAKFDVQQNLSKSPLLEEVLLLSQKYIVLSYSTPGT